MLSCKFPYFLDEFLLSAINSEMVNPISSKMSIDKYRSKAAAHFRTYPKLCSNQPIVSTDIENMSDFLLSFDNVYNKNPKTLKWLHIHDLAYLDCIVEKFGLHDIVETTFRDVRPHCSFIETAEGFVVSTSHCVINSNDHASFYKVRCTPLYTHLEGALLYLLYVHLISVVVCLRGPGRR